jgi:hypothetical protein
MSPGITSVDDRAAGSVGDGFREGVDQRSLAQEILAKNPNRAEKHPFRVFCERVIRESGVPDAQETREMASIVCGEVAKLPFLPDAETPLPIPGTTRKTTEFEQQIEKTARRAEEALDSAMVWTASALKIARTALELRQKDPDGSKGIAWVNDPLPGEDRPQAPIPSAFTGEPDTDDGEDHADA